MVNGICAEPVVSKLHGNTCTVRCVQVIADFDMTLTRFRINGERGLSKLLYLRKRQIFLTRSTSQQSACLLCISLCQRYEALSSFINCDELCLRMTVGRLVRSFIACIWTDRSRQPFAAVKSACKCIYSNTGNVELPPGASDRPVFDIGGAVPFSISNILYCYCLYCYRWYIYNIYVVFPYSNGPQTQHNPLPAKFQFVFSFFLRSNDVAMLPVGCHSIIKTDDEKINAKRRQVHDKYYPMEIDPTIAKQDKLPLMEAWWPNLPPSSHQSPPISTL